MTYETLLLDIKDHIATVTLNRPDVRNAINTTMVRELHDVLGTLAQDKQVGALIFTGAGGKAFAAGADIGDLLARKRKEALQGINQKLFQRIEDFPWPTIAAINGYAIGGACELAIACDMRIVGESAKMGVPEVSLGIIPAAGALYRLPQLIGLGLTKELVFTGRLVEAQEALRIGLINRVVPDKDVLVESKKLAQTILQQGPLAIQMAKAAINGINSGDRQAAHTIENLSQAILFESKDKHQRMTNFLSKKKSS